MLTSFHTFLLSFIYFPFPYFIFYFLFSAFSHFLCFFSLALHSSQCIPCSILSFLSYFLPSSRFSPHLLPLHIFPSQFLHFSAFHSTHATSLSHTPLRLAPPFTSILPPFNLFASIRVLSCSPFHLSQPLPFLYPSFSSISLISCSPSHLFLPPSFFILNSLYRIFPLVFHFCLLSLLFSSSSSLLSVLFLTSLPFHSLKFSTFQCFTFSPLPSVLFSLFPFVLYIF